MTNPFGESTGSKLPAKFVTTSSQLNMPRRTCSDMVDPTSDVGEDISEEDAPECVVCGTDIVELPTHSVIPTIEDGQVEHDHFCSTECHSSHTGNKD